MKLSELRDLTGAKYLQQVKYHRQMLVKKGLLSRQPGSRSVSYQKDILGEAQLLAIPVLGAVNAGLASIYAESRVEDYLRISSRRLPTQYRENKKLYSLKVVGYSMDRAEVGLDKLNIDDGDYVIADGHRYVARSGDYVVSLIDGLANVKKLIIDKTKEQIILLSESSQNYPPIVLDLNDSIQYLAQSKVIHVVKL